MRKPRSVDNLELDFGSWESTSTFPGNVDIAVSRSTGGVGTVAWLRGALGLQGDDTPFPWQEELLTSLRSGVVPRALDVPTGLGKTAVMAIWLVARAMGAPVPRRLVYVVDRRAVVDQATEVAAGLRSYVEHNQTIKRALGLKRRPLPISTLRGQYVDNREWLEDPAAPAIAVGTVDMVGSRLLFEGYGVSRKMRPYHAGLLSCDTLVVLDEAHLVPPFEKLIEAIADDRAAFGPRDEAVRALIPSFRLLSLSATGRIRPGEGSVTLSEKDLQNVVVRRRLNARKRLVLLPCTDAKELPELLAAKAWELSGEGRDPVRCIVFCKRRKDAESAATAVRNLAKKAKGPVHSELFVGARRVFERQCLAVWLERHGFIAGSAVELDRPAFLFATSAGEVGVDLDADHMVSDLVEWERMVQRLGRVNRRGAGEAKVVVFSVTDPDGRTAARKQPDDRSKKEAEAAHEYERMRVLRKPLTRLPRAEGGRDASPGAIRELKLRAGTDEDLTVLLDAATTPPPLRPALSRALVDAWSMTSLEQHTGRPEIAPWLRGWEEKERSQTRVVWRAHLPVHADGRDPTTREAVEFFEAAPPHLSEVLETETLWVVDWLTARALAVQTATRPAERSSTSVAEDNPTGGQARLHDDHIA
ncbi:MAG: type I-U CRISPR-associated helicase/endonuclease Cas3, partial [Gemmatimonadetes bacterium]|nr:type I-U CRISPR-associated helicase/endonuclease Cas3 [Gemmatimonadota bacterium]